MTSLEAKIAKLRRYNESLLSEDEPVLDEEESFELALPPDRALDKESIIMRKRRPVLAIQDGAATLEFKDPADGAIWKEPLESAKDVLAPVIAAVGRIDLENHPDYSWVGTGWLVHEHVLVTNRHVAEEFATHGQDGFVFQTGIGGDVEAAVDFLQEIDRDKQSIFKVKQILHIEPRQSLDLAFLEVDQTGGTLAKPIPLSQRPPARTPLAATIGYPAFDTRIPEPDLMERIYGKVYDKKRLAPGAITDFDERRIHHNCTTLGGNSGSVVIDLKTGEALGLHFSGSFLRTNLAVRADLVRDRLDGLLKGTLGVTREKTRSVSLLQRTSSSRQSRVDDGASAHAHVSTTTASSTSLVVPLLITVSLGNSSSQAQPMAGTQLRPANGHTQRTSDLDDEDDDTDVEPEAKPQDYADRKGYAADFLEAGNDDLAVALPRVVRSMNDVLKFNGGDQELRYEHFSVVMHKRRRMCFFSACNIDGARSKSSKRTKWRFDPRIPTDMQIMKECYGNAPKFSRGHMTRREDPAWGTPKSIQRGSDDSMHVTNATPQMQSFNSPIWLGLEDYALEHARSDRMCISVFTGPYFSRNDPTMFGVRIPVKFWKIIAFIHDETGELCATGYEMSQEGNLETPEFVFGDFRSPQLNMSTQVPIASIEARSGVSFGNLVDFDPLAQEGPDALRGPLTRFEQIRFL